jgi:hypothetical protein
MVAAPRWGGRWRGRRRLGQAAPQAIGLHQRRAARPAPTRRQRAVIGEAAVAEMDERAAAACGAARHVRTGGRAVHLQGNAKE